MKKYQCGTDTSKYCSLCDQHPGNVYKCTFPTTNDI